MNISPNSIVHYLKPEGFYFFTKPCVIRTVLGSCVTITMYSRSTGMASACHPVLPWCKDDQVCNFMGCKKKYRFVGCVIPEMVRRFKKKGVDVDDLEVKLFGGSEMLSVNSSNPQIIQIGKMNVEMAEIKLENLGLKLKSHDTGGTLGRRLLFDTKTGDVWIKKISKYNTSVFEKNALQKEILLQKKG